MPRFSVIIPTHNRAPLIPSALRSVFAQTFTDFETIVVDDGSTDNTAEVVRAFAPRVLFLRQPNRGPGAARNLGIAHASGAYVAFLDSDDIWFPWTLATYAHAIDRCRGSQFISGRGVPMTPDLSLDRVIAPFRSDTYQDMYAACDGPMPPVGGTPSVAISTETVRHAGGFCEEFVNGEDTDLWLRLGAIRSFQRVQEPAVFAQRYHSDTTSKDLGRSGRGALLLVRRELEGT